MNLHRIVPAASACLIASSAVARPPVTVDYETGTVTTPRNVVRSPGDTGTYFRLHELTGTGPFRGVGRLQVVWAISDDREVRLNIPAHERNWLDCIRKGDVNTNGNIDLATKVQVIISLAEMSARLNRTMNFDAKTRKVS